MGLKMCAVHWAKLRAEVDRRGLGGFVAESGEQAAKQLGRGAEGEESIDTFDPLMGANMAITANAVGTAGAELMFDPEPRCPICYLQAGHDTGCPDHPGCGHSYEVWIPMAVEDQAQRLARIQAAS